MNKKKDKKKTAEKINWEDIAKRALADLDNYKKQQEKMRGEMTQFMNIVLLGKFLAVRDDLVRAEKFAAGEKNEKMIQGLKEIVEKFDQIFEGEGLDTITVKPGDKFDPATMEAISHEEHKDIKDDHVIEQFEAGLKYKDQVLKPAKVRVGK